MQSIGLFCSQVAQAVKAANRRISDPKTGTRMNVITSKVAPLWAPLPPNEFDLIKVRHIYCAHHEIGLRAPHASYLRRVECEIMLVSV